jgi:hypothetical protein
MSIKIELMATHGGKREGSGRIKLIRFKPLKANIALLAKWESLGYKSQDDLINFCLAVVAKELNG